MIESDTLVRHDEHNRLRIGIDARILAETAPMGVSRYMTALLRAAAELEPQHEYLLYVYGTPIREAPFTAQPFRQRVLSGKAALANLLIWQQFCFPWQAWRDRVNVVLSPYYSGPLFSSAPQVVCICDISFSLFPRDFPSWIYFKAKLLARPVSRKAARVVTISEFSRQEIVRVYKLALEKVVVIHAGNEDRFWWRSRPSVEKPQVQVNAPFFLFVGSFLPRRQVGLVVQALARLPFEYHFVLVGESDPAKREVLMSIARQWNVTDRVHCAGHVSDEELDELYRRAIALVSPSTYEGFGLPVLEAMNRGLPVIAWDIPVMREVAVDVAVLLNIGDVAGLATAMLRVGIDPGLRQELCCKGKEQVKKFSWERSAAALLAVLHDAAKERHLSSRR
jgi:glycosyltransferase involved in cell wall biosynthesis